MGNTTSTNNFVLRDPALTSLRSFIEDSIPTIYTDEQLKEMGIAREEFERAVA